MTMVGELITILIEWNNTNNKKQTQGREIKLFLNFTIEKYL